MKTIKQLRKENNLHQQDLANLLGIAVPTYSGKETGYRSWKVHEASILCSYFGVDINSVIDFLPNDTRKAYQDKEAS